MKNTLFILTLIVLPVAVSAESLPKMKPGLWEVVSQDPQHPMKQQLCIDEGTQERMTKGAAEALGGMCTPPETKREGNLYTTTASCNFMGKRSTTVTRVTVISDEELRQEVSSSEGRILRSVNTYRGPCPADMKGGDMRMGENGKSINVEQFKELGKVVGEMGKKLGQVGK